MGFPRVVIECLLALAQHTRGWTATESVNPHLIEVLQFWIPPGRLRCITWERGGVPVHHDPVDGIVANPGNREWEPFPLSFFVVCDNPVHGVMVN